MHGRAELASANEVRIHANRGTTTNVTADRIFIATGSQPRNPPEIPIDQLAYCSVRSESAFASGRYPTTGSCVRLASPCVEAFESLPRPAGTGLSLCR